MQLPTKEEFLAAIEKNNYPQIKYAFFELTPDNTLRACAMGQGLLNANLVNEKKMTAHLKGIRTKFSGRTPYINSGKYYSLLKKIIGNQLVSRIQDLNDIKSLSCAEIVKIIREEEAQHDRSTP